MPDTTTALLGLYHCRARTAPVFVHASRRTPMVHQLALGDTVQVTRIEDEYRCTEHGWVHRGFLRRRNPLRDCEVPWNFELRCHAFSAAPYLPGGTTADGADCSGLVWGVFRGSGHTLPRWVVGLQQVGTSVPVAEAQVQDLVLVANRHGNVRHVGVVGGTRAGVLQVVHTSMTNGGARYEPLSALNVVDVRRLPVREAPEVVEAVEALVTAEV